ncbi:uncharacterized protein [Setaria viridis]|uniref:uncharacterized protein n=1 Tax=Setaria viridis TaxID=4556 RepID=UPI0014932FC6|nr:uncharacterized protein LOC117856296 [Setaria viridis]
MSAKGYKIIEEKYYLQTGLKHERRQLRNRLGGLKTLYTFWKALWTNSGLGKDSDGNVVASDEWWEENTKGKKWEYKKQAGAPEYIDQLEEIFHESVVDGSTSFNPSVDEDQEEQEEQEK